MVKAQLPHELRHLMGKYADAFTPAETGLARRPSAATRPPAMARSRRAATCRRRPRARYYRQAAGLPIVAIASARGVAYQADDGKWYLEGPRRTR